MGLNYTIRCKLRQFLLKVRFLLSAKRPILYSLRPKIRFIAFSDNVNSKDIYTKRSYEDREIEWCINWLRNGDSFIDCGANIGYFCACLSQSIKLENVIAIEGNKKCALTCEETFDKLGLKGIETINQILHSNDLDSLEINDLPGKEGLQYAKRIESGTSDVQATTLDQITTIRGISPSLVKVDCEGAETEILKGSHNLLTKVRPAWVIEVNDEALNRAESSRLQLFSLLRENRYLLFHISSAFQDIPFGLEIDDGFQSWSFNLAAIPMEQPALDRWHSSRIPSGP